MTTKLSVPMREIHNGSVELAKLGKSDCTSYQIGKIQIYAVK